MVFGIDPDELTVTGLDGEDPKKLRDRSYDLVHRTVVLSPDVTAEDHQLDSKTILVLHLAPGPAPHTGSPWTKAPGTSPSSTCAGARTYPAQPGELREAARTRLALNVNPGRRIPGNGTHRQPPPEPREKAACSDG